MRPSIELRDRFRVNLSSRREEFAVADVRAFFHSIYTHAIPWAIHSKTFAKRNRGPEHYGNLIDLLCRNAQDGQTLGLPVGPDTSRLIAEVLASAVDTHLQERLNIGGRDASRYIDDYTLSSPTEHSGEELLATLRQAAAAFELELNSDKSAVYSTSHRQAMGWQQAVRMHLPHPSAPGERVEASALQHFLYQLGRICLIHPDINVEKYGIQNARSAIVHADDWSSIQFTLINAYRRNPSLVSLLVEYCLLRQVAYGDVSVDILQEFIGNRIPVLARANRTGEIIWLLFLAIRIGITLKSRQLGSLFEIENAFIALLVTCLDARGHIEGDVNRGIWNRSLTADGLRSPMWLYAYEAVTRGFLSGQSDNFIVRDPYFCLLRAKRVQFFDLHRGFTSITETLRNLRHDNDRMRRMRNAILNMEIDEFDDFDEGEEDDSLY